MKQILTNILLVLIYFRGFTSGLDFQGASERKCKEVTPVEFNLTWALENTLYYSYMSRIQLYYGAGQLNLPLPPKEIIEGSIYYDSCIKWNFRNETLVTVSGYNGAKSVNFTQILLNQPGKGNDFESNSWPDAPGGRGNIRITLTDGRTFAVKVVCYGDGEFTWGVLASIPKLPQETIEDITAHVVELGFSEEYFTELRFDNCD